MNNNIFDNGVNHNPRAYDPKKIDFGIKTWKLRVPLNGSINQFPVGQFRYFYLISAVSAGGNTVNNLEFSFANRYGTGNATQQIPAGISIEWNKDQIISYISIKNPNSFDVDVTILVSSNVIRNFVNVIEEILSTVEVEPLDGSKFGVFNTPHVAGLFDADNLTLTAGSNSGNIDVKINREITVDNIGSENVEFEIRNISTGASYFTNPFILAPNSSHNFQVGDGDPFVNILDNYKIYFNNPGATPVTVSYFIA
jgi:hypothetical protein